MTRSMLPDMYVLDALADDTEDLATILRVLNGDTALAWARTRGREFTRAEVVEALTRLIRDGLVRVAVLTADGRGLNELPATELPPATYDDVWFAITGRGRVVHTNWNPEEQ